MTSDRSQGVHHARERLAAWLDHQRARSLALLDRTPALQRLVSEITRVEVIDRSLAVGAQALLALLPFLVALAALAPADLGSAVVGQVQHAMGLTSATIDPLRAMGVNQGQVAVHTGFFGLLIVLVSATSFSRALQRMYVKVFETGNEKGAGRIVTSVVWLGAWIAYVELTALVAHWSHTPVLTWTIAIVLQLGFWWWTAHAMLLRTVGWSTVAPVGITTTIGISALVRGSSYVMPTYTQSNISSFGSFGLILALASWLVAFAGVLVVGAVTGRLISEQPWWTWIATRGERIVAAAAARR